MRLQQNVPKKIYLKTNIRTRIKRIEQFSSYSKEICIQFFVHLSCCICVSSLWYLFCRCCRYCRCYRCCIIRHQKIQKSTWTYQRQRFVRWHRESDRFVILKLEIVRFFFFQLVLFREFLHFAWLHILYCRI